MPEPQPPSTLVPVGDVVLFNSPLNGYAARPAHVLGSVWGAANQQFVDCNVETHGAVDPGVMALTQQHTVVYEPLDPETRTKLIAENRTWAEVRA